MSIHAQRVETRIRRFGLAVTLLTLPVGVAAQQVDRLRDRGPGLPVSMFGTYIERGQWLIYPFFEYYLNNDEEYSPDEFGYGLDQDFRGRSRGAEGLIFLAYGVSDRLAIEFEAAVISESIEKAPDDPTSMPARIEESGLGDVEGQIRWRWMAETARRPMIFSYFETVFPLQKDRVLIGTQDWEFKLGSGVTRGFSFGTLTLRLSAEYDGAENVLEAGEYALDYLKRVSPALRVYLGVEGSQDEVEMIPEVQVLLRPNVVLKLNSAFGLTPKAEDWAPEVGVMVSVR